MFTQFVGEFLCLFFLFGLSIIYCVEEGWIATVRTDGVSRGASPLALGHPIRCEPHPVGARLSRGKSSVLYCCFRLMQGKELVIVHQHEAE